MKVAGGVLVPEGDGAEPVGAFFEVGELHFQDAFGFVEDAAFVFDFEAQGFFEGDGVLDVPAVDADAVAGEDAFIHGDAGIGGDVFVKAPGVEEVFFGAGAFEAGGGLAVDVEEVVAFAEPAEFDLVGAVDGADVVAAPFGFEDFVVAGLGGVFLAVVGVEVGGVFGEALVFLPIEVVVEGVDFFGGGVVGEGHAEMFFEGHAPEAGAGSAESGDDNGDGGEIAVHVAVSLGEEIAEGGFDTGFFVAVVVDAQGQGASVEGVVGGDGVPEFGNDAGAVEAGEFEGFSGGHFVAVTIAVEIFGGTADALGLVVLLAGEGVEVGGGFGGECSGGCEQDSDKGGGVLDHGAAPRGRAKSVSAFGALVETLAAFGGNCNRRTGDAI